MKVQVIVHPNAKTSRVEKVQGILHVYVNKPARDGLATEATAKLLVSYFSVPKYCITLVRGAKSRQKVFEVST